MQLKPHTQRITAALGRALHSTALADTDKMGYLEPSSISGIDGDPCRTPCKKNIKYGKQLLGKTSHSEHSEEKTEFSHFGTSPFLLRPLPQPPPFQLLDEIWHQTHHKKPGKPEVIGKFVSEQPFSITFNQNGQRAKYHTENEEFQPKRCRPSSTDTCCQGFLFSTLLQNYPNFKTQTFMLLLVPK